MVQSTRKIPLRNEKAEVNARLFPKADIHGGGCGTDERHLHEIAKNVQAARKVVAAE
jgi:methionine synthase I (cobalamin-dependent)